MVAVDVRLVCTGNDEEMMIATVEMMMMVRTS